MAAPPDLERGVAPLGPPAPAHTAPRTWGSSSPPVPGLGRGVAPPSCTPVPSVTAALLETRTLIMVRSTNQS